MRICGDDRGMKKARAMKLLGGTNAAAAHALGISRQAVFKWPDPLSRRIEGSVLAALGTRAHLKESTTTQLGRKKA